MAITTNGAVSELLCSTRDPAYSVDHQGRVTGWNEPAHRLLGFPREEVLGRACYDVLGGRDVFGNPFCGPHCPLLVMARRREPVRHFQMDVQASDGSAVRVLCFALTLRDRGPDDFSVVHLLRPADQPLSPWPEPKATEPLSLTAREMEVLRSLAAGASTQEMVDALYVSPSTVRKHIQNLTRKLGVTSRLAAVVTALEQGLL